MSSSASASNDDFANAEELAGTSATASGTNVDASVEPDEPEHVSGIVQGASVWYSWTAPADAEVTVDTCGSDFDTLLAVYTGSSLASLDGVGSSDDEGPCAPQSQVGFDAVDGTTYWIAVDGYSGAQGAIDLELLAEVPPPPGPPEDFYVRANGTGTDCTEADPCPTIAEALAAHRVTSGPGDVIDIGPGDWAENVEAGEDVDDGLTIRGTLDTDGSRLTTITGSGSGGDSCPYACVVLLGDTGDADVTLRDVAVNTDGTDGWPGPIMLANASDLDNVHATAQSGAFITAIVEQADRRSGKVIEDSIIDARDTFAVGIWGDSGATIRDSQVHSDYQAIQSLGCGCSSGRGYTIVRSWIANSSANGQPVMNLAADLTLDSSLVTGGGSAAWFQGSDGGTWQIDNSTVDVGEPGVEDTGGATSLQLANQGSIDVDLHVNSSILVEPVDVFWDETYASGVGSVACSFSDMRVNSIAAEWTGTCQPGSDSNVTTDPAELFVGGGPFSWELAAGADALDSGDPSGLGPSLSTTDLAGEPRVQAGTAATCPGGIRDKGAYERRAVPCTTGVPQISGTPEVGETLTTDDGEWTGNPTSFAYQWRRCAGPTGCVNVGSDAPSYLLGPDDLGHRIRVRVVATNGAGSGKATSLPTPVGRPTRDIPPQISGTPEVGETLTTSDGEWTGNPTSFAYQWRRCAGPTGCVNVGSDAPSYLLGPDDLGHRIRVRVRATNGAGSRSAASGPTPTIGP